MLGSENFHGKHKKLEMEKQQWGGRRSTVLKMCVAACVWLLKMCDGDTGRIMGTPTSSVML